MKPFTKHSGKVVALDRANVDTDQIIPKQFLKRIERTGFGEFLFLGLVEARRRLAEPGLRAQQARRQGRLGLAGATELRLRLEP